MPPRADIREPGEGLEQLALCGLVHSRAIILDEKARVVPIRAEFTTQRDVGAAAAVFCRVTEVVDPDLCDPRGIAQSHRPAFRLDDAGVVLFNRVFQAVDGLRHDRCGVDRRRDYRLVADAGQNQQLVQNTVEAGGGE